MRISDWSSDVCSSDLLAGFLMRQSVSHENFRLFVGVGILGGFTTFSSFSLDVATMIERGDWGVALGYVLVSVIGSVLALFGGLRWCWNRHPNGRIAPLLKRLTNGGDLVVAVLEPEHQQHSSE